MVYSGKALSQRAQRARARTDDADGARVALAARVGGHDGPAALDERSAFAECVAVLGHPSRPLGRPPNVKDIFVDHPSSFVQVRNAKHRGFHRSSTDCFEQFNPSDAEEYRSVVDNWSAAYLEMAAMVAKNIRGNGTRAIV